MPNWRAAWSRVAPSPFSSRRKPEPNGLELPSQPVSSFWPPSGSMRVTPPRPSEVHSVPSGSATTDSATADSLSFDSEAGDTGENVVETVVVDAVQAEPAAVETADLPDEAVVVEVAEQLGSVVGDDVDPDPAEFAAAAVLDVLRAAGWADAAEAADLRAEATRLRELLAEVIRDHRAREASAAGGQNQQLYWLVPLLRLTLVKNNVPLTLTRGLLRPSTEATTPVPATTTAPTTPRSCGERSRAGPPRAGRRSASSPA